MRKQKETKRKKHREPIATRCGGKQQFWKANSGFERWQYGTLDNILWKVVPHVGANELNDILDKVSL